MEQKNVLSILFTAENVLKYNIKLFTILKNHPITRSKDLSFLATIATSRFRSLWSRPIRIPDIRPNCRENRNIQDRIAPFFPLL